MNKEQKIIMGALVILNIFSAVIRVVFYENLFDLVVFIVNITAVGVLTVIYYMSRDVDDKEVDGQ